MRQEFASTRSLPQRRYHAPVPQFTNRRDIPYQHRSPRKGHLTEQNEKSTEYARGFLENPSSQASGKTVGRTNSKTHLRKRQLSDEKITNEVSHSAEADEYDLDDYQLLLERHRLIQQQLSVIGQQEEYLEAQAFGSANFEDDADFVIVPDPNCIDESSEMNNENVENPDSCFTEGAIQMSPENIQNTPEAQEKEVINDSAITENPSIESKGDVAFLNQPKNTDNNNVVGNKEQTENIVFVDKELGVDKVSDPQPQKKKRNRQRRQRRKKFKSKNPNLQVVAKESKQVEATKNKVDHSKLQDNIEQDNGSTRKKRKLEENEDNYQVVPMTLEDEYEIVDSWLEDADEFKSIALVEASEPQIAEEPPTLGIDVSSANEEANLTSSALSISPAREVDLTKHDSHDADDSCNDELEELEDVVALRQQLLQSLVTKRAQKARAVISEQQAADSPIDDSMSPSQEKEQEKSQSRVSLHASTKPKPLSVADKRPRNDGPLRESFIAPTIQESIVIQIGLDSESDEEDDDSTTAVHHQNSDAPKENLFGGAISDFLKEARHGLTGKACSNSSPLPSDDTRPAASKGIKETPSNLNAGVVEKLGKCISEAVTGIKKNRVAAARDNNMIKFLAKKISTQKSRIEQQELKLKRLRQLLATGEKTKKTLATQCLEFQDQVKSLRQRIKVRSENNLELDEEVQRARNLVSKITAKEQLVNTPKRLGSPAASPSKRDSMILRSHQDSNSALVDQISKTIAKMKVIMARKTESLPKSSAKLVHVTRRRSKESTEESSEVSPEKNWKARKANIPVAANTNLETFSGGRSSLKTEKERLQRLEKELQKKLESIKKLSAIRMSKGKSEKVAIVSSPTRDRIDGIKSSPKPLIDLPGSSLNHALSGSSSDVPKTVQHPGNSPVTGKLGVGSGLNNNNAEMKSERALQNASTLSDVGERGETGNDLIEKSNVRLSVLFQDGEQLKRIQQELLQREFILPNFESIPKKPKALSTTQKMSDHCTGVELSGRVGHSNEQSVDTSESEDARPALCYIPYTSPLLNFRSYRLSPWFRMKEKKGVGSKTYSHKIEPLRTVCPYDWSGKCLDKTCNKQHASEAFSLTDDELLQDLILYEPRIADISAKDSLKLKREKITTFVKRLREKYGSKMTIDHLIVLLIHDIKELRKQAQNIKGSLPYNVNLVKRSLKRPVQSEDDNENEVKYSSETLTLEERSWKKELSGDRGESQELRYFEEDYDIRRTLEALVNSNPSDVKSWILLAKHRTSKKYMTLSEQGQTVENENHALNILSKALEANPYCEDLWMIYLDIFSKRNNVVELREMFVQAVDYCRSYAVWWKCLQLEKSYDDKIEICLDILGFLLEIADNGDAFEVRSHHLLETVLYILKLETERHEKQSALTVIQSALGLANGSQDLPINVPKISRDLSPSDLVLLWLCHISLVAFSKLPQALFDPSDCGPSRIVSKAVGLFDWKPGNVRNDTLLRSLFKDASKALEEHPEFKECQDQNIMQLYANSIQLEITSGQQQNAVDIANQLSKRFAHRPSFSLMLLETLRRNSAVLQQGVVAEITNLVLLRSEECIHNYATFLLAKGTEQIAVQLLTDAIEQKFELDSRGKEQKIESISVSESIRLYRRLLGISNELVTNSKAVIKDKKIAKESREYAYLWLNFCLLLELTKTGADSPLYTSGAEEAFEIAVNSYTTRENREILWLEYLHFKQRAFTGSSLNDVAIKSLLDSGRQCLACIPSSKSIPYHHNLFWNDYTFHNKVIAICLQYIREPDEIKYLKEDLKMMPTNAKLALRTCQCALASGSSELARTVYGFILKSCPHSYSMWKMALSVELKSKKIKEARWLYEEATKMLPFSATLWKDFVLFEIAHGRDARQIQTRILEIATTATPSGILVMDYVRSLLR
ncbi:zinc finger C3H1 domain-containing protein-like [Rhopilema esculentum]|uniref:zinc finger C3H1 domain-containing protein-like n=1 Tax=Rhopilema esculentum TaxID=499914 RepID=UPI0031D6C875